MTGEVDKIIELGKPYKKLGKLPLYANGVPIPVGTRARTTDGVCFVKIDADSWRRLDGPEIPYISIAAII